MAATARRATAAEPRAKNAWSAGDRRSAASPLVAERVADASREVFLRQPAVPRTELFRLAERHQRGLFVGLVGLERVERVLRCAEEGVDPAVVRHLGGEL